MSLKVSFNESGQSLTVTWNFSKYRPTEYFDYIYISEEDGGNDDYEMLETLQNPGKKGSIKASAMQLESGQSYVARWMTQGSKLKEQARSKPFTLQLAPRQDVEECEVTVSPGNEQAQVVVKWNMKNKDRVLSDRDVIAIIPFGADTETIDNYYSFPYVQTSGRLEGSVNIMLRGCPKLSGNWEGLEAAYLEISKDPYFRLGKSAEFSVDNADADTEAWEKSQRENQMAIMQYQIQEGKEKMANETLNPLLTIVPEENAWQKLLKEHEDQKESNKEKAAAKHSRRRSSAAALMAGIVGGKTKGMEELDEKALLKGVVKAFKGAPGFLYLGAGTSMGAPSCSPSWWALMRDTLRSTFDSVRDKHPEIIEALGTDDAFRQPEEIMESFYFTIQDRLFSLFELLKEGKPNATHHAIAALAKAGKLKAVLTTNFDMFLEDALRAANVEFVSIITTGDFMEYGKDLLSGSPKFAVLKIHGSLEKLDTIVAVANQYKGSKGFTKEKADVVGQIMAHSPTLFLGYSGWDFEHENYQAFLEAVGENGGPPIFWLKRKGETGGPDLQRLVVQHVGKRLVVGQGMLPDFGVSVLKKFDGGAAATVEENHAKVAKNEKEIIKKMEDSRRNFVKKWTSELPLASVLTLVMIESINLNENAQKRQQKINSAAKEGGASSVQHSNAMTVYFTTLAADLASGKITQEEYTEQLELAQLDMTMQHIYVPKVVKDHLKKEYARCLKEEPLFTTEENPSNLQELKGMVTPLMRNASEAVDVDGSSEKAAKASAKKIMDLVIDFLKTRIKANMDPSDPVKTARKTVFLYNSIVVGGSKEVRDRVEPKLVALADLSVKEGWSDDKLSEENGKMIEHVVREVYGMVDSTEVLATQLEFANGLKSDVAFVEAGIAIASGLSRLAAFRTNDLGRIKQYQNEILTPLYGDADREIDDAVFYEIEKKLEERYPAKEWSAFLKRASKKSELMACVEVSRMVIWAASLIYVGPGYFEQIARANNGFYSFTKIPTAPREWLKKRGEKALKQIKDRRFMQPLLGVLSMVYESEGDIKRLQSVTERSLDLSEGKVTETTPVGIPEGLAALYQDAGDLEKATQYWELALEGVATSIRRSKADEIVLNACLCIAATKSTKEALIAAFNFSPLYAGTQASMLAGPGRPLLVQQASAWAKDLGLSSVEDARTKLLLLN